MVVKISKSKLKNLKSTKLFFKLIDLMFREQSKCQLHYLYVTKSKVQSKTVHYITVLYCTVLYCTVLYCTVLYPITLFFPSLVDLVPLLDTVVIRRRSENRNIHLSFLIQVVVELLTKS